MSTWRCLSVLLLTALYPGLCFSQSMTLDAVAFENFDTRSPIVRVSPVVKAHAAQTNCTDDWFGFSVTVHLVDDILTTDSVQAALAKTRIIVGSPRGAFPGGISGVDVDPLACAGVYNTTNEILLSSLSQDERLNCLKANLNATGLVYQCNLNDPECEPILGNGDARSPDGYLFERRGNDPDIMTYPTNSEDGDELKQDQLMGYNVYSKEGVFVVCAPFWKHESAQPGPQPRGRCVYSSGKSLANFAILLPCITGNRLNQNQGGYCSTGFGIGIKKGISTTEIVLGSPGRYFSRGGVAYYANASDQSISDGYRQADVPPSVGGGDAPGRREYDNTPVPEGSVGYYGFSFAEGYIISDQITSFLVGAPRYDKLTSVGYVFILPHNDNYFNKPIDSIKGEQIGEMFGFSIIALDLNNDGYDDVVVGAPFYSGDTSIEIGRIFIFENSRGNGFLNARTINGFVDYSRFGTVLTSVGDINNDGYQDFAVSAPYEGSGVVYIYYGQQRDSMGSIVDNQYKQRIDGASVADQVSDLDEVKMFGYSLSSEMDIDNNQYKDLVVGAFESQAVFIFRSHPVASVSLSATSDFIVYNCTLDNSVIPCLTVEVCALYHPGNKVAYTFNATYRFEETSTPHRFYFDSENTYTKTGQLVLTRNETTCFNTSIHIIISNDPSIPFNLTVNLLSEDKPFTTVNTSFVPTDDLSESPFIKYNTPLLQNTSVAVPVVDEGGSLLSITTLIGITVGVSLGVIAILVFLQLVVCMRKHKRSLSSRHTMDDTTLSKDLRHNNEKIAELQTIPATSSSNRDDSAQSLLPETLSRCLIKSSDMKLVEKVGQGEFGVVYRGLLTKYEHNEPKLIPVAVKTLKRAFSRSVQTEELIEEAEKMMHFDHLNILSLTGVCVGLLESPCIVMPFMSNGSLLSYLRKEAADLTVSASSDDNIKQDTTKQLLSMCLQIAKGMVYLTDEHKFVHRDLAARNCMISSDGVIKVADFGLAEDVYTTEYFKQDRSSDESVKLPLKWMALESIHYGKFSEKSDVWSFGVLCWEVFSVGKSPYPGMGPLEVVDMLDAGNRLSRPSNAACCDNSYSLILTCWEQSPDERPHFFELVERIEKLLGPLADYVDFTSNFAKKFSS